MKAIRVILGFFFALLGLLFLNCGLVGFFGTVIVGKFSAMVFPVVCLLLLGGFFDALWFAAWLPDSRGSWFSRRNAQRLCAGGVGLCILFWTLGPGLLLGANMLWHQSAEELFRILRLLAVGIGLEAVVVCWLRRLFRRTPAPSQAPPEQP